MARDIIDTIHSIERHIEARRYMGWVFRGEPACFEKISSGLYREHEIEKGDHGFDINDYEEHVVRRAKEFTDATDEIEILEDIQHRGGKTNQIDFTYDLGIAMYFACGLARRREQESGRVIMLAPSLFSAVGGKKPDNDLRIRRVKNPIQIAASQKSVFVSTDTGYLDERFFPFISTWTISREDKDRVRRYLEATRGITLQSVFMDLSGFIRNQSERDMALPWFIKGQKAYHEGDFQNAADFMMKFFENSVHDETATVSGEGRLILGLARYELGENAEAVQVLRNHRFRGEGGSDNPAYPVPKELKDLIYKSHEERVSRTNAIKSAAQKSQRKIRIEVDEGADMGLGVTLLTDGGESSWHHTIPKEWQQPGGSTRSINQGATKAWWSFYGPESDHVVVELQLPGSIEVEVPRRNRKLEPTRIRMSCEKS